ncbi:MAG: Asp/Glu racemase, partial [Paracoccaceae bacterium]
LAACKALGVGKIAFLSPYIEEVSATLRNVLIENGLEIVAFGTFNEASESKVARIAPASIRDAALDLINGTEAEAVFLSCTNLQTLDIIVEIEEATGRPALSSNLVLGWHMLKLSNRHFDGSNFGRLMQI